MNMRTPLKWEIKRFRRVIYRDRHTKKPEYGYVSNWNDRNVWVKFDKQLDQFGWDGTTSQACDHDDLTYIKGEYNYAPVV